MSLSSQHKQQLKAQAHHLNPIVLLGSNGLTEAVHAEIERGLIDHELIKVRLTGEDRQERKHLVEVICEKHAAACIQLIGRIVILYRKNPEKN
jgi:RNA-binding protein